MLEDLIGTCVCYTTHCPFVHEESNEQTFEGTYKSTDMFCIPNSYAEFDSTKIYISHAHESHEVGGPTIGNLF